MLAAKRPLLFCHVNVSLSSGAKHITEVDRLERYWFLDAVLLAGLHKDVATYYVEEYSMSTNTWIDRAPLMSATFRTAGAYVNGVVYVFGGDPTCEQREGEEDEEGGQEHPDCVESDILQVYFDIEQPNIFIA